MRPITSAPAGEKVPATSIRLFAVIAISVLPLFALLSAEGGLEFSGGDTPYALLAWSGFCVALFTASLCFLNFTITGNAAAPVIGIALTAAGAIDGYIALIASGAFEAASPSQELLSLAGTMSRALPALIATLGVGLLLVRNPTSVFRERRLVGLIAVAMGAATLVMLSYCTVSTHLPRTIFPSAIFARPYDVLALALFALAGSVVYPAFHALRRDAFSEAVWLSAIPAIAMQLHMVLGSTAPFDAHWAIAHGLKIGAYALPGIGLLWSYIETYRSEAYARQELQDREEFLRLFRFTIDHSADCALWIGERGQILYANEACYQTLGWSETEIRSLSISEIDPSLNPTLWREHWNEIKRESALTQETEHRGASGTLFPVEITYNFVDFEGSASICALFRDISNRKRVEAAVQENELRLRSIVRNAAEGIITIDDVGTIDTVNPAAERIFGYSAHELIGKNLEMLIPSSEAAPSRWNRSSEKLGAGRSETLNDITGRRQDGSAVPLDLSSSSMNINGRWIYTAIIRDITERKEASEELATRAKDLAQSNAELEQFAYVASHDLQEPLRMISSFVKLLEQKYADTLDDTGKEYIHFAVDGADRMQALIQDLLSYSRVGSRDIPLEPVDCDALIQIVLGNLAIAIEEAEASVSVGPLPTVLGDPRQLSQLFQNLISNAIKFKNPERAIGVHISCTSESDRLTFSVTDNGIGIKDEHHERIFAIFQRLHTREEYKGTGIGLSICRKIVDRHGGKIWLESRVGVGTAFHFTLLPAESEKDAHDLHDNFS